ncbi:FHA domain-containing protein [Plantactinospora sp. GCM10030261]|uniref:FHA domain-containing protein n=1 Tax=Plantactinospora sp. GCM10030261 TaxID=3273420 RepID=UPI003620B87B
MRFEISKVLDTIEGRVTTDPTLVRAAVDLAELVRFTDLDRGRPASMLRLGIVIDALGRQVQEDGVQVYAVVHRGLLSDGDLTSNERMVVRRWADDGLVEVLNNPGDRMLEVADLLGLPVLTRARLDGLRGRYPWIGQPGRVLAPVVGAGGPTLAAHAGGGAVPAPTDPSPTGARLLARLWRCPEPGCALFGAGGGGGAFADLARVHRTAISQPPPSLRGGAPSCPRHDRPLTDAGARPRHEMLAVRIGGLVRQRFVVADRPVVVGRAPEEDGGITVGQWLNDEARRWISRSHLRLELRGADLVAQDVSTNGSGLRPRGSLDDDDRITLNRQQSRVLGPGDFVELYPGVQVGRAADLPSAAAFAPASVMAEAPTMTMRTVDR